MRNICTLTVLFVLCFSLNTVQAQVTACDTINSPIPGNWTATTYTYNTPFGTINGYLSGINVDNYSQQANYFDLSATANTYILGTIIRFTKANSNIADDLSKFIYFRVYADNAGLPGTEITTASTQGKITLGEVKENIAKGFNTNINFPSSIALPASKKFYVSVDMSAFLWNTAENIRDSIAIATTADNQTINTAWGYDADVLKWKPYSKSWDTPPNELEPLDATLYIFPYVATAAGGCGLLPVQLLSFNAVTNANDAVLTWQISSEINMKSYEVEKAANNGIYKTVATVNAVNSLKNQQYAVTDKNAFATSATVQYRLKQIDGDGSIKYSRVITLSSNNAVADVTFANPFSGALKLQLTLSQPQTVSVKMYDMQGRLVAMQSPSLYSAASHTIALNTASSLKPGTYLLQVNAGKEQKIYKVVKQ